MLNPLHRIGLVYLWLFFVGPLWLAGWGVREIAYQLHILAMAWCRLCVRLLP